jgi:ribosome-binding protein aMBF1 (putative translation factor)
MELYLADAIFRLGRFVEDTDLSFYQIASRLGIPSTILTMWLAGTARPNCNELDKIERLLES